MKRHTWRENDCEALESIYSICVLIIVLNLIKTLTKMWFSQLLCLKCFLY